MATPGFLPGLDLSEMFFHDLVEPLIASEFPALTYAAGRIGAGSDVTGYDTARSMDHDWGPRLTIWLDDHDFEVSRTALDDLLRRSLPARFRGFPTGYARHASDGTFHMEDNPQAGPVDHLVEMTTVGRWFGSDDLPGTDTSRRIRLPEPWIRDVASWTPGVTGSGSLPPALDSATWVTLPQQWLLEMTSGRIFRDDTGAVSRVRASLGWYPDTVWRYLLAAQWMRVDQLEPFIGRTGEVDDDLGSHLVAMTLVRDAMRLAFLLERRYAPYPKWFGTAFGRLDLARSLSLHLARARHARTWQERERGVVEAMVVLITRHNEMGLTRWIDPAPRPFHSRPFTIVGAARISDALRETIRDPRVQALPPNIGGLDQFMDSTDALVDGGLHRAIRKWMGDSND